MDVGALVQQFGLPLALSIYLLVKIDKLEKERLQDMRDIIVKATEGLNKSADALEDYNKLKERELEENARPRRRQR